MKDLLSPMVCIEQQSDGRYVARFAHYSFICDDLIGSMDGLQKIIDHLQRSPSSNVYELNHKKLAAYTQPSIPFEKPVAPEPEIVHEEEECEESCEPETLHTPSQLVTVPPSSDLGSQLNAQLNADHAVWGGKGRRLWRPASTREQFAAWYPSIDYDNWERKSRIDPSFWNRKIVSISELCEYLPFTESKIRFYFNKSKDSVVPNVGTGRAGRHGPALLFEVAAIKKWVDSPRYHELMLKCAQVAERKLEKCLAPYKIPRSDLVIGFPDLLKVFYIGPGTFDFWVSEGMMPPPFVIPPLGWAYPRADLWNWIWKHATHPHRRSSEEERLMNIQIASGEVNKSVGPLLHHIPHFVFPKGLRLVRVKDIKESVIFRSMPFISSPSHT